MNKSVLRSSVTAFFAALICASSFFRIPVPGIVSGIVIQNAVCILTAVILGGLSGAAPTALFFFAGVIGLPVFSGGQGGFQVLMNINGGYRIGWVLGALVSSIMAGKPCITEKTITVKNTLRLSAAVFAGLLLLYLPEVFYVVIFKAGELGVSTSLKLFVTAFFVPFLPVDFIKAVFVVLIALKLRPVTALYLGEAGKEEITEEKSE